MSVRRAAGVSYDGLGQVTQCAALRYMNSARLPRAAKPRLSFSWIFPELGCSTDRKGQRGSEGKKTMENAPFKKGEKIRIKKGTKVSTTHPVGTRVAGRTYTVTVHDSYPAVPSSMGYPEMKAQVNWLGAGGYWCWTDAENVEKVA